ncbi:MAG: hypothetical protein AAGB30_12355 [Pedobacter sp.]
MLQKLSYFNIFFALVYVLLYLKSGTLNSTAGILAIIVFNWLYIRGYHLGDYRWKSWHFIFGAWSAYFAGFMLYATYNIIKVSIAVDFWADDTVVNILISLFFSLLVWVHIVGYWNKRS